MNSEATKRKKGFDLKIRDNELYYLDNIKW